MKTVTATIVGEVTVKDPDTGLDVEVTIFKEDAGGMGGVDSSYLASDVGPVHSPHGNGIIEGDGLSEPDWENERDERLTIILDAAECHGMDSGDPEHEVGDLQDVVREAWDMLTQEQKDKLCRSEAVRDFAGDYLDDYEEERRENA